MRVIVYRGIPGSGKSTHQRKFYPQAIVFSADHYFERRCATCDGKGASCCGGLGRVYSFDKLKIGAAHLTCLRLFTYAVTRSKLRPFHVEASGKPIEGRERSLPADAVIVVDNTSSRSREVSPYVQLAQAHGHDARVVTVLCDPAVAWKRNVHGVGLTEVVKMDLRLRRSIENSPGHWSHEIVFADVEGPWS